MFFKIGFIVLAIVSIAQASVFTACDNGNEPVDVKLDNCFDEYCEVKQNQPAKIEVTFKAAEEETKLNAAVLAIIGSLRVPFSLGKQAIVCDNLVEGKCPLPANSQATYSLGVTIPKAAPVGTRATVELKITNQDKALVMCTRIAILVTA